MSEIINPDWASIKADYLAGNKKISDICIEYGVSSTTLMQHRAMGGWPGRYKTRVPSRKLLIARMFVVFEQQIEKMELAMLDGCDDKEIALLGQLVRTLEKLVELDTKQKTVGKSNVGQTHKSSQEMKALREKLSRRIHQLEGE